MQHTATHNLHEHSDLEGSNPINATFSQDWMPASLTSRKPHPLALLQLRRAVAGGEVHPMTASYIPADYPAGRILHIGNGAQT